MLIHLNTLLNKKLAAEDGEIGHCEDFIFDDQQWVVRYMQVDTGRWLPGQQVLVSPVLLKHPLPDRDDHIAVRLSEEQIRKCPGLDQHAPISREYEKAYHQHYMLPLYWQGMDLWGVYPTPSGVIYPIESQPEMEEAMQQVSDSDNHLRSTQEVKGYQFKTADGDAGHVSDFIFDDETWRLRYLVVETRHFLPGGRQYLVCPQWISHISWADETVSVDFDQQTLESSPPYEANQKINEEYELKLFKHYGQQAESAPD